MLEQKTQQVITEMGGLLPLIVSNALNALGAVIILVVGLWLSGSADRLVVKTFARTPHFDPMLRSFFGSLARYLVLTVTVLAVLSEFGIQTTSLVAVLGAAGLAVGLALQGTLSNLAAGVMLLIFRPFKIGHKVQIGGSTGVVKDLSLFWTELVTDDKVQIIVPNGGVWGQPLRNYSAYPVPPTSGEARFGVAEETDLDMVITRVRAILGADTRVLADPAPSVLIDRTGEDYALTIVVTFATAGNETGVVKSDLFKAVHAEFGDSRQSQGSADLDRASLTSDPRHQEPSRQPH
jgi:small conductance mechanosensitive channel